MIIGVISAPRPFPTLQVTVDSLKANWPHSRIRCFVEPGAPVLDEVATFKRPVKCAESDLVPSPEGKFGNFQNWIQAAMDLLYLSDGLPDDTPIMICEDDVQLTSGIAKYVEAHLWPKDCGVVSLYSPSLGHYRNGSAGGLCRTRLVHSGDRLTPRNNLVGALCLIFPRHILRRVVRHKSQKTWGGSHEQVRNGANVWDIKAVDTWIGRVILELGLNGYHFFPGFARHYCPEEANGQNSSLGNGGMTRARQTKDWAGHVFDQNRFTVHPRFKYPPECVR